MNVLVEGVKVRGRKDGGGAWLDEGGVAKKRGIVDELRNE